MAFEESERWLHIDDDLVEPAKPEDVVTGRRLRAVLQEDRRLSQRLAHGWSYGGRAGGVAGCRHDVWRRVCQLCENGGSSTWAGPFRLPALRTCPNGATRLAGPPVAAPASGARPSGSLGAAGLVDGQRCVAA